MATWVTHLMIADAVLEALPMLDRRSFCVGNIAPDCNIENEDWTVFTPPRSITHWMQGDCKQLSDCEYFFTEYVLNRKHCIRTPYERDFLLGYYAHLIADAAFQAMIRNEARVKAAWKRIKSDEALKIASTGMNETWDSVKMLIPQQQRMLEIHSIEAKYLSENPSSGYCTEILPLTSFPDYIDYLPKGCIVRKIKIMSYLPHSHIALNQLMSISYDEYASYVFETSQMTIGKILSKCML